MRMKIKSERDFWAGAAFVAVGLAFSWGATNYSFGSSAQPGPGFFPFALGLLLASLGALLVVEALTVDTEDGEKIGVWAWKPVTRIVGAVILFGWVLPVIGLALALPLLVVISALAGDEFHWGEALLNAVGITLASWAIFSVGLKLTIPLWPSFLGA